jgi:hypothetical protein
MRTKITCDTRPEVAEERELVSLEACEALDEGGAWLDASAEERAEEFELCPDPVVAELDELAVVLPPLG